MSDVQNEELVLETGPQESNQEQQSQPVAEPKPIVTEKKRKFYLEPVFIMSAVSSLLLLLILILHYPQTPKPVKWEYKVVSFYNEGHDRTGSGAIRYSSIDVSADKLDELGRDGWELASSALEMETAFPNFGNTSYVTGLQPNVRPQKLVCIFKRPIKVK